jgi:hypothetical protein
MGCVGKTVFADDVRGHASRPFHEFDSGSSYTKPRRILSASARRRISLAQKARWAKRAANDQVDKLKPRRTMSASARRKIAAAQRARWAKVKAQQWKAA